MFMSDEKTLFGHPIDKCFRTGKKLNFDLCQFSCGTDKKAIKKAKKIGQCPLSL